MNFPFIKMHGLGNDFIILDGRQNDDIPVDALFLSSLANRKRGIGCDQIIILRYPKSPAAHVFMDMYNADGSIVRACGNATRCVAQLLFDELHQKECVIETVAGLLHTYQTGNGMITVDFGMPKLEWQDIPLARPMDTLEIPLVVQSLSNPCCVNMGNPHAVFFVADAYAISLDEIGPKLEHDVLFPDRCNIEVAQILSPNSIRMRVWERGAGITEACGTGACATLVAAIRRGLSERRAKIILDGGEVIVEWREDNHILLTGDATMVYRGYIDQDLWPTKSVDERKGMTQCA